MTTGTATTRTYTFTESDIQAAINRINGFEELATSRFMDAETRRDYAGKRWAALTVLSMIGIDIRFEAGKGYALAD